MALALALRDHLAMTRAPTRYTPPTQRRIEHRPHWPPVQRLGIPRLQAIKQHFQDLKEEALIGMLKGAAEKATKLSAALGEEEGRGAE